MAWNCPSLFSAVVELEDFNGKYRTEGLSPQVLVCPHVASQVYVSVPWSLHTLPLPFRYEMVWEPYRSTVRLVV